MALGFDPQLQIPSSPQDSLTQKQGKASILETTILKHFESLEDPRLERTKSHPLINVVAIAILAVIAGADGWTGIETYGKAKHEWLEQFLDMANGVPSHDTFARVFARLDPQQLQQCFSSWIDAITQRLGVEVIAIDGKTLKQSYDREHNLKALHVVSAWASSHRLVLGQVKVAGKSNEITAIPTLLEVLDITGCIITIDAIGCQKEIAAQIIGKKADYVFTLKGNQGKLAQQVKQWFEIALLNDFADAQVNCYQTCESGHHRIETRQYFSVPIGVLGKVHNQHQWKGLQSVVMVVSERRLWNRTTREVRFYISSLPSKAQVLANAIRSHWGVENKVHWTLDVTFKEDASRIRKDYAAENFALLRRLTLNLLNQEKTFKGSHRLKRYQAAMDNNYLLKILAASQFEPAP